MLEDREHGVLLGMHAMALNHDLRNKLSVIIGYANELLEKKRNGEFKKHLNTVWPRNPLRLGSG